VIFFILHPQGGKRSLSIRDLYISYRKTALNPDEVLQSVDIPFSDEGDYVESYKQSKRKEDDLAIVSACFYVKLSPQHTVIDSCFAFGGVAPIPVVSPATSSAIAGAGWQRNIVTTMQDYLEKDHHIPISVPGGVPEYRRVMLASLALKFFLTVAQQSASEVISPREASAFSTWDHSARDSSQSYELSLVNKRDGVDTVGEPHRHTSALEQV
jgi:xanthine dehydrogenase/oxidase